MSTAAWTKFGSLALAAWSHHIARTVFSHTAAILEEQRVLLSPHASLHRCFILLEHIDAVIQNISPERRRKIQAAAERGLCRYLSDVDLELERRVLLNPVSSFQSEPAALSDFTMITTDCARYMGSSRFSGVISQARISTGRSYISKRLS